MPALFPVPQPDTFYSKSKLAEELYGEDYAFDPALPQSFLDQIYKVFGQEGAETAVSGLGWAYLKRESDLIGRPLPVTQEGFELLCKAASCLVYAR